MTLHHDTKATIIGCIIIVLICAGCIITMLYLSSQAVEHIEHHNRTANPTPMTDGRYWVQCSSIEVWLEHHPGYVLHHGTYHNWIVKKATP